MSLRPTIARLKPIFKYEPCVLCQFRVSQPVRQYAAQSKYRITREQQLTKTPQQLRMDVDARSRFSYFTVMQKERLLYGGPIMSEKILNDFLMAQNANVPPVTNIQQLCKKYRAKVGAITYIAIAISQIGDIKDPSGRLPPSQHHKIAAELLFACSAAKDVMATLQIMSAYWLSTEHELPRAKEIASNFTKQQINECMAMLEQLSDEGDTDCMTMRARMLEKVGHRDIAKGLYRSALAKAPMVFDPKWPHPMALPWVPPWIALADLLLADKHNATLDARAQAKAVLEKGAFAADDPLAYYRLASFENGHTPDWVQYMSKAAASGHIEAAYKLGRFYMDVHANPKSFLAKSQFKSALNFITSFKGGSADRLAREWLEFAASTGHKPSMLELMKLHDDAGDHHTAAGYLRRITEAPENGSTEEWPNVVREARRRSVTGKVARITA